MENHKEIVIQRLKGSLEDIYLVPLSKVDPNQYLQTFNDKESLELTGTNIGPVDVEQIKTWLDKIDQDTNRYDWAICLGKRTNVIGEICLNEIDKDNQLCHFRISLSSARNQGIGSLCTQKALQFVFEELKLNKVELEVYEFNPRAIHVYEKLGFVREGVRRKVYRKNDQLFDSILMGMLREEYLKHYSSKCLNR